jgi:hypothetical protein
MNVEINQFDLHRLFADPSELYDQVAAKKGYSAKRQAEFDVELIAPGWTALECVLLVVMVHQEKRAHVSMLPNEDLTALRESLEHLQVSLNLTRLVSGAADGFGTGLVTR